MAADLDNGREALAWASAADDVLTLAQIAAAIAHAESNIDRVEYLERDTSVAAIRFSMEVQGRKHLAAVIRRIRRLHVVHGVQRL